MRLDRPLVYVLDPDLATIRSYHIVSVIRLLLLILMRRVILRLSGGRLLRKRGMMVMIHRMRLHILHMMHGLGQRSRTGFIMHTIDRIVIVGLSVFELQAGVDHHTRWMTLPWRILRVWWLMGVVVMRILLMGVERRGSITIPLLTSDFTPAALGRWLHHQTRRSNRVDLLH